MATSSSVHFADNQAPLGAQDQYMRLIRQTTLLPWEEMDTLVARLVRARHQPGNAHFQMVARHAREELIEAFQPLVLSIAKRYVDRITAMSLMDLVQEGNVGLLTALEVGQFRHAGGLYALVKKYIFGYIQNFLSRNSMISLHAHFPAKLKRLQQVEDELFEVLGHEPGFAEIADAMGISVGKVCELWEMRVCSSVASLQGLLGESEADESYLDVVGLYQEPEGIDYERQVRVEQMIQEAVASLPSRQSEVMRLRYGLDGGPAYWPSEINEMVGVKGAASSETSAKKKLRLELAALYSSSEVA